MSGLKKVLFLSGIPVRPSTKKERRGKKQLAEAKRQTALLELIARKGK